MYRGTVARRISSPTPTSGKSNHGIMVKPPPAAEVVTSCFFILLPSSNFLQVLVLFQNFNAYGTQKLLLAPSSPRSRQLCRQHFPHYFLVTWLGIAIMGTSAPDLIIAGTLVLNALALLASRPPQKNTDDMTFPARAMNVSPVRSSATTTDVAALFP